MFFFLLHASLCLYILPVLSLIITVPTQPHPLVNASTSILLTWEEDDPSHFSIAVHRNLSTPGPNITSIIRKVENFTATRNVSLVFPLAGNTSIETQTISPTQANVNVTFAQSAPFQVDEDPTGDVSTSSARDADYTTPTSATVSSTINSSTTASTSATSAPSSNPAHKGAIIAGVVCGAFLFASITTVLLIWRYRKRRNRAPSRAFLNDLDDKRQPRTSRNDRPPHDPPPPYSPRISRVASKLFRWARSDDDSVPAKTP
ncbi:hypothetical protein EDD18DRAFT_1184079 [Armillaria luteobubalina]|uniref:Mid2 domain-containing protein n=1 Tax=Armillaria luteobubalina TaxID=153913 RepID=A0AA39PXN8_9AGAR|nr:hypothetical protein EDD18DRAFT_1184079 [Armillaria luteobubalina]